MHLLETRGLQKTYNRRRVVDGVEISVKRGEIVGLLGPNGAGKTTTFYMITGLIEPDKGEVIFDNQDITNLPMHRRARCGIGYLAQEPSIFRKLTVEENIMAILETLKISKKERKKRLEMLLGELRISHLAKNYAYTLSEGSAAASR
jgi:lipopolysaccharide export system ATP-binding protein